MKLSEVKVQFGVKNGNEAKRRYVPPRPLGEGRGDKRGSQESPKKPKTHPKRLQKHQKEPQRMP